MYKISGTHHHLPHQWTSWGGRVPYMLYTQSVMFPVHGKDTGGLWIHKNLSLTAKALLVKHLTSWLKWIGGEVTRTTETNKCEAHVLKKKIPTRPVCVFQQSLKQRENPGGPPIGQTLPSPRQMRRCLTDGNLNLWPGCTLPAAPRLNLRRHRSKVGSQRGLQSPPDASLWSPAGSHRRRRYPAKPCWSRGRKLLERQNKGTLSPTTATHQHKQLTALALRDALS